MKPWLDKHLKWNWISIIQFSLQIFTERTKRFDWWRLQFSSTRGVSSSLINPLIILIIDDTINRYTCPLKFVDYCRREWITLIHSCDFCIAFSNRNKKLVFFTCSLHVFQQPRTLDSRRFSKANKVKASTICKRKELCFLHQNVPDVYMEWGYSKISDTESFLNSVSPKTCFPLLNLTVIPLLSFSPLLWHFFIRINVVSNEVLASFLASYA